jgi:hypothetical protein
MPKKKEQLRFRQVQKDMSNCSGQKTGNALEKHSLEAQKIFGITASDKDESISLLLQLL